jgi:GNAT superfamily N-acetyltransferase
MKIVGPSLRRQADCEAVLRSLPMWFGIEDALLTYARESGMFPTFALEQESRVHGFITLIQHFPVSWEVHCIAVAADARNKGLGTQLLNHAENWVAEQGARFLQIKTVASTSQSREYAQTQKFYEARGYLPPELFPTLWSPRNPALQLIKSINAA